MTTPDTPHQENRRGCLFYALVISASLAVLVLLGLIAGYYTLRKAVDNITERAPRALPEVQVSSEEAARIQRRLDAFRENVRARLPTPPLTLTDQEINALITTDPEFKQLRDKVRVKIEDGKLRGEISVPLEQTGLSMLKGRYLNGTATFQVQIDSGMLQLHIAEVTANGKPLPKQIMSKLSAVNFAQEANQDPQISTAIGTLKSIEAKGNTLVVTPQKE